MAAAVATFHYRDVDDMKAAARMQHFPPQVGQAHSVVLHPLHTDCRQLFRLARPAWLDHTIYRLLQQGSACWWLLVQSCVVHIAALAEALMLACQSNAAPCLQRHALPLATRCRIVTYCLSGSLSPFHGMA